MLGEVATASFKQYHINSMAILITTFMRVILAFSI